MHPLSVYYRQTLLQGKKSNYVDSIRLEEGHVRVHLQKQLEHRSTEIERCDGERRYETEGKDREIANLRARLDASLGAERRMGETLQRVTGAGLWKRLTGFKALLGDGSNV